MPAPSRKITMLLGLCAAALPLAACSDYGNGGRPGYASDRSHRYGNDGSYHLRDRDRIYRDRDGRYYCKKPDGSTGLGWTGAA